MCVILILKGGDYMKSELANYSKTMSPSKSIRTDKVTKITIHHIQQIYKLTANHRQLHKL